MLAHLWVGLFRNFESGSHTMFITGQLQPRDRLMLHLACLNHRDNCRFRLDSQGTLLPTVAWFNLRMHHLPSMVVKSVETVLPEKVIPSHLLLNVVMPIMLMLRRLRKIRLS